MDLSPEVQAVIIKVAGNWALAMAQSDVNNKKAESLSEQIYELFRQNYFKIRKAIEEEG